MFGGYYGTHNDTSIIELGKCPRVLLYDAVILEYRE